MKGMQKTIENQMLVVTLNILGLAVRQQKIKKMMIEN